MPIFRFLTAFLFIYLSYDHFYYVAAVCVQIHGLVKITYLVIKVCFCSS